MKVTPSCLTLYDSMDCSSWNSLGQSTGVGGLSLLQGIFPTQGLNPGLPHCRWILYQLNQKGSPRILQWVAYPFPGRSSWSRNWTGVSCIAGRFFTNWTIREALKLLGYKNNEGQNIQFEKVHKILSHPTVFMTKMLCRFNNNIKYMCERWRGWGGFNNRGKAWS